MHSQQPASVHGRSVNTRPSASMRDELDGILRQTDVSELNEPELKALFETFIQTFKLSRTNNNNNYNFNEDDDEDELLRQQQDPYYLHQLTTIFEKHGLDGPISLCDFPIDLQHLKASSMKLLKITIRHPADLIVFMDEVLADLITRLYASYEVPQPVGGNRRLTVKTSLFNHPHVSCMRDLDPKDIESLVSIRGIVIRCSFIIPDMRYAVFRCTNRNRDDPRGAMCGYEEIRPLTGSNVDEPLICLKCSQRYTFDLFHSECKFGNKQLIKIQETPESIPEGETPQTALAYVYDEMVDSCKPGDFIEVTGIYRASGVRLLPRMRTLKSVYRVYIDVNSIHKEHLNRYLVAEAEMEGAAADADMSELDESMGERPGPRQRIGVPVEDELVERLKALGRDPSIYEKLVKSLAPNIWECDDVKKGLLCQLFGGTSKIIGSRATRNDIHILLCGDPSTAKSQLLKYTHLIAPRGVYTCGRGSSAVGLTAAVTRDPETKEFVLESGAILLSDRGVCCIDEFDKMDETARVILHEVMEQQTVSIAKAGIVCSLNARTAILASANPINSRYDIRRSVVDNISLPASLMSRFDLIYLMLDHANKTLDRSLAEHLCRLYSAEYHEDSRLNQPPISRKLFAQYLSYAREHCKPKLTTMTQKHLVDAYKRFRQKEGKSLGASPRQLESLIRLSEALAKMELNENVEPRHVAEAIRLMQVATYSALIDPATGQLDFDQLNAGVSSRARERHELLEEIILGCLSASGANGLDKTQLATQISEQLTKNNEIPVDPNGRELNLLLRELEEFGKLARVAGGRFVAQVTETS